MNVRKTLGVWAALAVALYVVFLCLLYISQRTLIYPGTMNRVAASPPHAEGADVFRIATAEGTVDAIFLPAVDGAVAGRKPVMIYAHGNGEVIDYWLTGLQSFREHGIGVLLVEYPGYGRSTGLPSEKSIRASMEAAFDRIAADPRVDRDRIFGFGQSLGGGAICALARSRPLRALILQSAFPSLDIFAAGYWAPTFLLRDPWP
jgi:pimeloyl-ACP methyl ester carboxylesterase